MAKDYGTLHRDDNQVEIPTGTSIQTFDATASSQDSPLAVSNSVITIAIPTNAAEIVFKPSAAMRVSEVVGMGTYFVVAADVTHAFGVARMDNIYVIRDSGDLTLNFYFVLV